MGASGADPGNVGGRSWDRVGQAWSNVPTYLTAAVLAPYEDPSGGAVIPSYTALVKTAISVPDETYERASRRAGDLGISRSEFFARAAERYLEELDARSLTGRIDDALERLGSLPDETSADAVAAGRHLLDATGDEW